MRIDSRSKHFLCLVLLHVVTFSISTSFPWTGDVTLRNWDGNSAIPAKQASKMLYLLCNLGLVFTSIITSTFITIVTGKLRMFRIIAVTAKAIFSTWFSCLQIISFMGHAASKDPALDSVTFMAIFFSGCSASGSLKTRHNMIFMKYA